MISEQDALEAVKKIVGAVPKHFPAKRLAEVLNQAQSNSDIVLSVEGLIRHALSTRGSEVLFPNVLTSQKVITAYIEASKHEADVLPQMLWNAATYLAAVLKNCASIQAALPILENMTTKPVLYLLLQMRFPECAERYAEDAFRYSATYPAAIAALPKEFQQLIQT